jgi:hypothetical protein
VKDRQAFVSDARKLHVQFLAARTDALAAFYRDALAEGVDGTEHLRVAIRSGWYERECLRFYNAVPKMKYDVEVQAAFDVLGVASPECEEFVAERLEVYAGTFAEARQAEAARIAERERAAGCPEDFVIALTERLRMGIHDLAARAGLTICEPEPGSTFAQYVGPYDRQRSKIVPVGVYAGVAPAVLNFLEQDLLAFLSEIRKTSSRIAFGQNPIYAEHCSDGIVWKLRCAFSGLR